MIQMKDLEIGFTEPLLTADNIELNSGLVYALVGPNGKGKTTLLRTLNGLLPPLSGELYLEQEPAKKLNQTQFARKIAMVTSRFEGVDHLTVYQYVALGRTPYLGLFGRLSDTDHTIVESAIHQLGLKQFSQRVTSELSDGERQMASIARALSQDCPIITLDEPTAFLDYGNKDKIINLLIDVAAKRNKCILFSTHDLDLICRKSIPVLQAMKTKKLHLFEKCSSVDELTINF